MSDRATSPPVEFFSGAQHFSIENQYISVTSPSSPAQNIDVAEIRRLLSPVPGASHTRNTKRSPPDSTCLPGTRTELLSRVTNWVKSDLHEQPSKLDNAAHGWRDDYGYYHLNPPSSKHVVWLCGPVGCGKSAIAQIVAKEAEEAGLLAASFFFFRGMGDRSKIARLADTLACQMAEAIPSTAPHIRDALTKAFALQGASVETQFDRLIYEPIRSAFEFGTGIKGPFLILLDGLDECEDRDEIEAFIDHMLSVFDQYPNFPLRFFISSRIEEHIREHIETSQVHVLNLRDHHSDHDISTLVHHTFKVAASRNRVIRSYGKWPSDEETKALIRHAKGSFIFVRTLLNFILGMDVKRDGGRTPMERFKLALNMDPGLDGLYDDILQQSRDIPHSRTVILTLSLLQEPLSISGLSRLLDIPTFDIVNVLIPLQSVIHVPGDDETRVTLFHTSLRDFIKDEVRSHSIFSPASRLEHKELLARRCLQLRFEVNDGSKDSTFPYAMHYWSSHWHDAHGHLDDVAHCLNILIDAGVGDRDPFPLRLVAILYDALDRIISPRSDQLRSDYEQLWLASVLGPSQSRAVMDISRSITQPLQRGPVKTPDPSLLKCMIMHKMRSIASCFPRKTILSEFIEGHIMRDLRGIIDSDLDNIDHRQDVHTFLQSSYRPEPAFNGLAELAGSPSPVYAQAYTCGENVRDMAKKIDAVWPGLLCSAATVATSIPDYSTFYKEDGLTVLDMLNVFLELGRLSAPKEGKRVVNHVITHVYDGMLVCISTMPEVYTSEHRRVVTCLDLYTDDIFEEFSKHHARAEEGLILFGRASLAPISQLQ